MKLVLRHSYPRLRGGRPPTPLEDKYIPEPNSGCWLWTSSLDRHGYGQINIKGTSKRAHRIVYERLVGPIPAGLVLDHTCRVRSCVNPDHLEPITVSENLRRGISPSAHAARQTHCIHGHEFSAENTRLYTHIKGGTIRICRSCERTRQQRDNNLPILRASFSNPWHWGWHRYLWAIGIQKGTRL